MFLTKRQLQVLDFLRSFLERFRVAPTLDEMAAHFKVSRITIHEHLRSLEDKGVIRRTKNRARSIELVEQHAPEVPPGLLLPILGLVRAGAPCQPFENPEPFDLANWIRDPSDYHLLRVAGESMIQDHIADGDLVLIDRRRAPIDGDIVVAATPDGDVTLKRIYREAGGVRLQPSHPDMQPLRYASAEVRGVVVGLIRKF
ncbi:MAG: repressor LexA [Planctomycetes bacterium]|nr:repressor LexA [Planctomycetota bacterium]